MAKGLIPMPPIETNIIDVSRRNISDSCRGYDWLGYRPFPKALVYHRARIPKLAGRNAYQAISAAYVVRRLRIGSKSYYRPRKTLCSCSGRSPSGWASGPISAPYGDGAAFKPSIHTSVTSTRNRAKSLDASTNPARISQSKMMFPKPRLILWRNGPLRGRMITA